MEVFVARQPIFDRQKDVFAYELLFRSGFESYYDSLGAQKASADLMAFVNFGELTDGKRGFATFTRSLLLKKFPAVLPSDLLTVGIPVGIGIDQEVVAICRKLKEGGFVLVMDDFSLEHLSSPLTALADIIRVDFQVLDAAQRERLCKELLPTKVKLLARKVETADDFAKAFELGFTYFQGSFLCKPAASTETDIPGNKLAYLRLLNEVNRGDLSLDDLEGIIKTDVTLTYRLLRFMNSAWFGIRYEVNSVRHALVLLGPKEIRKWASMLVLQNLSDDKPQELLLLSLVRAKVAEQLAPLVNLRKNIPELFLMGMFSALDALLDRPMPVLLEELPVDQSVKAALLGVPGPFRNVYDLILAYEGGDWKAFSKAATALNLNERAVPDLVKQSIKWANQAINQLAG